MRGPSNRRETPILGGGVAPGVGRRPARGLAGYVETADGEPLAFAILANNFSAPAAEVTGVIDEALAALAAFSRR